MSINIIYENFIILIILDIIIVNVIIMIIINMIMIIICVSWNPIARQNLRAKLPLRGPIYQEFLLSSLSLLL